MQKILLTALVSFLMAFCAGCSVLKQQNEITTDQNKQTTKQKNNRSRLNVEAELLATAQSIEQSLSTLAAAEKAENTPILNTAQLITPEGGMGGTADVDWSGPLVPLVEKIAEMSDYRLKVLGSEPAIPILISVNAKRAVIADILQNASLQAGKRAHILVFPSTRIIEVRYLSE
jgi:defect-in-organelle-trafficking protein DotD